MYRSPNASPALLSPQNSQNVFVPFPLYHFILFHFCSTKLCNTLAMNSANGNGKANGGPPNGHAESQVDDAFQEQVLEIIKGDAFVVDWYGPDDPGHPQNLPRWRKWAITMSMALHVLSTTFASSVFSAASRATAIEFHVDLEVTVLATSLFMVGFAVGPTMFGWVKDTAPR
jgi:hypothetical protein